MELQTVQIGKATYEKLKAEADSKTMKLYGLLTMIVEDYFDKKQKEAK